MNKNESDKQTFDMSCFSTDLITECIVQHLESNFPQRHYTNTGVVVQENLKRWIRLTETLLVCLKHDLKQFKVLEGNKFSLNDRKSAASVICKWLKDTIILRNMYKQNFENNVLEDRIHKDIENLYTHLDTLCNLCETIHRKNEQEHESERQVVFIYDEDDKLSRASSTINFV